MPYNLLDEQWIPILKTDGHNDRVGIRDALTQSGRIRQIAAGNPMDRVAILRFLLAILYWCKGNPPTGVEGTSGDSFPADWFSKLDKNAEYFNLLGEEKRFYQCRTEGKESLAANYLVHEIPTGRNAWLFRHSTDEVDGLCPACCAMGLLRLSLFSTSGGRGKPPGVNAKPPVYIIPMGASLAETLRLLWRSTPLLGTPAWEQADMALPKKGAVPLLVGLTWLPRRVWLDEPSEPRARCISCGRKEFLIRRSVFAGIGSNKSDENGPVRTWTDPHVIYEKSKSGDVTSLHARDALGASDAAAGQWSRITAGALRTTVEHNASRDSKADYAPANNRGRVWVVGFATVQNDKYLEAFEFYAPYPSSPQAAQAFIERLDQWDKSSFGLTRRLTPSGQKAGSRKNADLLRSMLSSVRPQVEDRVSAKADELVAGAGEAWDRAAREYGPMMEIIAGSLVPGWTTAAVRRRQEIVATMPNMRQKERETEKAEKKKGGAK